MFTYLLANSKNKFFTTEQEVTTSDGYILGSGIDDYKRGRLVKLTEEQAAFHEANPKASPMEVLHLVLNPVLPESLEQAKERRVQEIKEYDSSDNVNSFLLNGKSAWLVPEQRLLYAESIRSYEKLNLDEAAFVINGEAMTISVPVAALLLALLQVYADACYMITAQHISEINNLTSIEDVNAYDITAGYPQKLSFEI